MFNPSTSTGAYRRAHQLRLRGKNVDFPISVPSIGLVGGKFVDENPLTGTPGSLIPSAWGNAITDEVLNVITAAGLEPSEEDLTQLLKAIRLINQKGQESYAVDTGVANAYVCAFTPAITARSESRPLLFKVKTTNTGASTLNDGVGVAPLVGRAHAALQGGELIADGDAWVQWNSSVGAGSYVLLFCTAGALQVAPATKSQHALQLGQKGVSRFTTSGSFTVPAGVTTLYASGCAAGGGGAGTGPTTGSNIGGGGGGGAGQSIIRQAFTVTPGQIITITIGAAGAAGLINNAGGTGGNTVIGSLITLTGGNGGLANSGPSTSSSAGGSGGAGFPQGSSGTDSQNSQGGGAMGGAGASCPFGGGGGSVKGNGSTLAAPGTAASGFGSGGGGCGGINSNTTATGNIGGIGAPGLVILEW